MQSFNLQNLHERIPKHLQSLIVSNDAKTSSANEECDNVQSLIKKSNFGSFITERSSTRVIPGFIRKYCEELYHIKGVQKIIIDYCCFNLKTSLKNFVQSTNEMDLKKMNCKFTLYKVNIVHGNNINKNNNNNNNNNFSGNAVRFLEALIGIHFGKTQFTIDTINRHDRIGKDGVGIMDGASSWREKFYIPIKICDFNSKCDEFVDVNLYMDALKHPESMFVFKIGVLLRYQALSNIGDENLNKKKSNVNSSNVDNNNNNDNNVNYNIQANSNCNKKNKSTSVAIDNGLSCMIDKLNKNGGINVKKMAKPGRYPKHIDNEITKFGQMYDFNGKERVIKVQWTGRWKTTDNLAELLKDGKSFTFTKCLIKHIIQPRLRLNINVNNYNCNYNYNDVVVCIGNKIVKETPGPASSKGVSGTSTDRRYNFCILNYGDVIQGDEHYRLCLVWSGCYFETSGPYSRTRL